ncbi:hypothetical protein DdX_06459 [Ditylenchus destructor]|uniref:C2H2-type domain-containing protein n=1 Tax=Ditylenchus destructor TaxID=166010 RepID=A0AAD4NB48_9BILA|nr:hypothetical protein DdX_06459 [Ditylenchus destructor]
MDSNHKKLNHLKLFGKMLQMLRNHICIMNSRRRKQVNPSRLSAVSSSLENEEENNLGPSTSNASNSNPKVNGTSHSSATHGLPHSTTQKSRNDSCREIKNLARNSANAAHKAYETILDSFGQDAKDSKGNMTAAAQMAAAAMFSSAFNPASFYANPLLAFNQPTSDNRTSQTKSNGISNKTSHSSSSKAPTSFPTSSANTSLHSKSSNFLADNQRKRPASSTTSSIGNTEPDAVLDLSVKKSPGRVKTEVASQKNVKYNQEPAEQDALHKLSSLVTTVGADLLNASNGKAHSFSDSSDFLSSFKFPQYNSPLDKSDTSDNGTLDPSSIFTCLQCFERFQTLEQLVKHMEKTKHFNAPTFSKHINGSFNGLNNINGSVSTSSAQIPNSSKPDSVRTLDSFASTKRLSPQPFRNATTPTSKQSSTNRSSSNSNGHTKSSSTKGIRPGFQGTFGFKCILCGHSSAENSIEEHMTKHHSFTSPNEWIGAVKLIPL